mgnify:CR=1 FL=1
MANLVDIFTQSSGLKGETTVLSTSEDLPKDKPSLFDSLLKTSIEDIENSSAQNTNSKIVSQNITSNLEKSPLDAEVIEVNTKLIDEGLDSEAINLDENSNSEEVIKDLSKNIKNELNKDNTKKDEIKAKHTAKLTLANRQKDDIISAISHEFKNPIAIISGYSQTLIEDENLSQTLKIKFLNKILSNSNKMSQIVDKLRLTLKLQDNNHKLILNKVSIKKIVENSISDLKIKYKNREIKVLGVDKEINADEILIGIAISNLIENALKYSQEDVIIEINENSISITDKGIGISQENLENIFKKYYRATSNNWNNSLGLGLFIVKSILNVHNFKLEINSKIGNGSTFKIYY